MALAAASMRAAVERKIRVCFTWVTPDVSSMRRRWDASRNRSTDIRLLAPGGGQGVCSPVEALMKLVVGAIIHRGDGRILIAQRTLDGSTIAGKWEFPGGKVEAGEDPRAALARECVEELGCHVEVGGIYETIFHQYRDLTVLLLFYLCRITEGTARALEHNDLAWVSPAEMKNYDLLEADRPLPDLFERRFPYFAEGLKLT